MRKFFLTFIFIVLTLTSASISSAECITNQDTIMYFDAVRFFKVARICAANRQQGSLMMMDDTANGDALLLPKGTRLDVAEKLSENYRVSMVKKGNLLLVGLTEAITCR